VKIGETIKRLLDRLATDLIDHTGRAVAASGALSTDDVRRLPHRLAGFSAPVAEINGAFKKFLRRRLYEHPGIVEERDRSVDALEQLFRYYVAHPGSMPEYYSELAEREPRHRVVCDYIAGMTDHFLLRQHREQLGIPAST
jgi:dGTPase